MKAGILLLLVFWLSYSWYQFRQSPYPRSFQELPLKIIQAKQFKFKVPESWEVAPLEEYQGFKVTDPQSDFFFFYWSLYPSYRLDFTQESQQALNLSQTEGVWQETVFRSYTGQSPLKLVEYEFSHPQGKAYFVFYYHPPIRHP
jgi:hypothetical protein